MLDLKLFIEEAHRKKYVGLFISSLGVLVQSEGFSLKTQPRLLLLPIIFILSRLDYSNCLLMAAPNSVVQPFQKI